MDKWTLQNLIWNEQHGEYFVNDLIISAVLDNERMQKVAQALPVTPAGPLISQDFLGSIMATSVGREFQHALDMFRFSIMKYPRMKRFYVWLEGILRAIDANRWKDPLPNAIMGVPDTEKVYRAMTSTDPVEYNPFAGSESKGDPQKLWDIKNKVLQDRATNVISLMKLFTNAINIFLARRF